MIGRRCRAPALQNCKVSQAIVSRQCFAYARQRLRTSSVAFAIAIALDRSSQFETSRPCPSAATSCLAGVASVSAMVDVLYEIVDVPMHVQIMTASARCLIIQRKATVKKDWYQPWCCSNRRSKTGRCLDGRQTLGRHVQSPAVCMQIACACASASIACSIDIDHSCASMVLVIMCPKPGPATSRIARSRAVESSSSLPTSWL